MRQTAVQDRTAASPLGLASADGLPWVRLVSGLVTLAICLAVGWRAGRHPGAAEQPATPQPVREHVIHAQPLPAQAPLAAPRIATVDAAPPPGPQASAPPRAEVVRAASAHKAAHWKLRPARRPPTYASARATRRLQANPWAPDYDQIGAARLTRRRDDLRREYLAARQLVAAFTAEDSGSSFLSRRAAAKPATAVRAARGGGAPARGRR